MGPPGSSSPAGTAAKPKTVPPVSAKRCQERKAPPRWCHPSVRSPRMVPPGSWSPAGTAAKPKTVPPVSSDRRQPGATRQSGGANWCHPPVRHASSSPADSAWKPETDSWGHPPVRLRQMSRVTEWCHPPVRRGQLVPSAGSSPADSARKPETVPPVSSRRQSGATPRFGGDRCKLGATPQSEGRKWRRRAGPVRPELLPFARPGRFRGLTQRR
jgi:hypothetical protein